MKILTTPFPAAAHAKEARLDLLSREFERLPNGMTETLCRFESKVIPVANAASRCGFTPRFEGLQELDEGDLIATFGKQKQGVDLPGVRESQSQSGKCQRRRQGTDSGIGIIRALELSQASTTIRLCRTLRRAQVGARSVT